jgi:hypothetical protein
MPDDIDTLIAAGYRDASSTRGPMPTITVPDALFDRLAARAAELGTSVDALAAPALADLAGPPPVLDYPAWKQAFDAHMRAVDARADQYLPGHVTDVSRESIYEGCGE